MAELTRRGLFRAFRASPADEAGDEAVPVAQIGDACVEPKGVTCRRCGDECDAGAIRFRLIGRGRAHADLDRDLCTGCGACLPVCPTHAITLTSRDRAALITGLVDMRASS